MRINREPWSKVAPAIRRMLDNEYGLSPGFNMAEDQAILASAYLDYVLDKEELEKPGGLVSLLVETGAAIDANNGQCGLIEEVLCRVTTLIVGLMKSDTEKTGTFRVGKFLDIRRDDKVFPTIREARLAAHELAKNDRREVIAVWIGDDLDRLFVGEKECEPVPF